MAYHGEVPAAEHGNLSASLRTHMMEGENQFLKAVKHMHTHQEVCASTHMGTH